MLYPYQRDLLLYVHARKLREEHVFFVIFVSPVFYRTAEEERLAAEARQPRSEVIDRETRRRLLHYFAYCPPGNGKNGKEGGKASSITAFSSSFGNRGRDHGAQQELSDAIGSSGRGAKFSDSIRGVFSRLPPLSNPTPCPHPLRGATSPSSALASPLPTSPDMGEVGRVNAQESSRAGDCEVPRWRVNGSRCC